MPHWTDNLKLNFNTDQLCLHMFGSDLMKSVSYLISHSEI